MARFLNERGIAAFVLYYRLARAPNSTYTIDGDALNDLKRAIRTVRSRVEWSADTRKIGAMGFSAGGQLVSLGATRADAGDAAAKDPVDRCRIEAGFRGAGVSGTVARPDRSMRSTPPMWLLGGSDDRPDSHHAASPAPVAEVARSEGARGLALLRSRRARLRIARHAERAGIALAAAVRRLAGVQGHAVNKGISDHRRVLAACLAAWRFLTALPVDA